MGLLAISSLSILCVAAVILRAAWTKLLPLYYSPLLKLRGPAIDSFFYGHALRLGRVTNPRDGSRWVDQYGPNVLTRWFGMIPCLWTVDPRVINHVISHSTIYTKPLEGRQQAARIIGKSLLISEGEDHRRHRRIMNPAFGPAQIRALVPTFFEKSFELRDLWQSEIAASGGSIRTNISEVLSRITLDIIGLAGFDYDLNSLNPGDQPNELNAALRDLFKKPPTFSIVRIIKEMTPLADYFPDERMVKLKEAKKIMLRYTQEMVRDKSSVIRSEQVDTSAVESRRVAGRDLLTLLMKANMATDLRDDQRLSEEEVLAQVPTFLTAGHETTSTAAAWCLYALSLSPRVQRKLREELRAVSTDTLDMDKLLSLPYLDCVVRETLRLYAPVVLTMRVATQDDVIPVSEPFKDRDGNIQHEIRIAKGNRVVISISTLHHLESIWGSDAFEFRPERWENPPEAITNMPGVWGHLLTFLGGVHACIGYRFSLTELKTIIFVLLRSFTFELAVAPEDIVPYGTLVQRPTLRGESEQGAQIPMIVRAYDSAG